MVFGPWTYPILMKKTQNPEYLHVKHQNTRKNTIKMVENTLFSQIDKILKIYPRLDEYISFPFFPGSRTGFKRLCGHILVSSKGDQTYYTNHKIVVLPVTVHVRKLCSTCKVVKYCNVHFTKCSIFNSVLIHYLVVINFVILSNNVILYITFILRNL